LDCRGLHFVTSELQYPASWIVANPIACQRIWHRWRFMTAAPGLPGTGRPRRAARMTPTVIRACLFVICREAGGSAALDAAVPAGDEIRSPAARDGQFGAVVEDDHHAVLQGSDPVDP